MQASEGRTQSALRSTPHEDGDDLQDLIDQEVTARDTEDMLEELRA